MTAVKIKEFLKGIQIFDDLEDHEMDHLAEIVKKTDYKKGDLIFAEKTTRKNLYIIHSGVLELFKKTVFGEERRITYFREGDVLGEGVFMEDSPHSASARAVEDSEVFLISKVDFDEMSIEHPAVGMKMLSRISRIIARRMRQTSTKVINEAAQYISGRTRKEHDLLGWRDVYDEVYYGVQTLRALENFNISGIPLYHFTVLIEALAMVKQAAVRANLELGLLTPEIAEAIDKACLEILDGKWHSHFVVDMIQGGAGTSTNMNANEVIANRALELLGHKKGEYEFCHPNNHVNLSQSTNDAYPTALKIALLNSNKKLVGVLKELLASFDGKALEFAEIIKMGRTQLQDAVPMTLGQSFQAYADTLKEETHRLNQVARLFLDVNMGGTAIGTGINADPKYGDKVITHLRNITGYEIRLAPNLVEATQDTGCYVMYSSAIKRLAVKLSKICNDLRLLSSGPRAGLNEINLPKMQPGSSIMPGKVNPVIPEVVNQIAFKVIGNDLTVTLAAEAGQLELNVMEPIIVQSMFESIEMLNNGMNTLKYRCIDGITANAEVCRKMVENSIGLVTALNPVIGYENSSAIAKQALEENRGVYELVIEKGLLSKEQLDELLKPENMV